MIYIFFFCLSETKWFEMAAAFSSRIPLRQLEKGKINCNERIRRAFCFLMDKISVYFAPSASRHSFRKLWGNACAAGEKSCRCSCVFFSKFWWWKQSLSFSYSQWICAVLKNKCCPVYRIRMLLFFFSVSFLSLGIAVGPGLMMPIVLSPSTLSFPKVVEQNLLVPLLWWGERLEKERLSRGITFSLTGMLCCLTNKSPLYKPSGFSSDCLFHLCNKAYFKCKT